MIERCILHFFYCRFSCADCSFHYLVFLLISSASSHVSLLSSARYASLFIICRFHDFLRQPSISFQFLFSSSSLISLAMSRLIDVYISIFDTPAFMILLYMTALAFIFISFSFYFSTDDMFSFHCIFQAAMKMSYASPYAFYAQHFSSRRRHAQCFRFEFSSLSVLRFFIEPRFRRARDMPLQY